MALSLKKQHIQEYRPVVMAETITEETGDVIVPDSWPDAERICGSSGIVVVRSKECVAGKATVSGSAKVWIIYQTAENETRSMTAVLPYAVEFSDPSISDNSKIMVQPRIVSCEGRVINSRKIQVKSSICVACAVFNDAELVYCDEIESDSCIEVRCGEYPIMYTKTVKEKSFTISDELQLESGKTGFGQLLAQSAMLRVSDKRLVGTKLVFKGDVDIEAVYLTSDGNVECTALNLPFSQIIDMDDVEETDVPWLALSMTSCELEILDDYSENLRRLELNMNVLAQAAVSCQQIIKPVLDFYSTEYETTAETAGVELTSLLDITDIHRNVREQIMTDGKPIKILDVALAMPKRENIIGNGRVQSKQSIEATMIYLDHNGSIKTQRKKFDVQAELELANTAEADVSCLLAAPPSASIIGDDVEINAELIFTFICTSKQSADILTDGYISEEPMERKSRPSAVLTRTEESLWQTAKKYGARISDIKAINGINDDYTSGKMLLIPKPTGATGCKQ